MGLRLPKLLLELVDLAAQLLVAGSWLKSYIGRCLNS